MKFLFKNKYLLIGMSFLGWISQPFFAQAANPPSKQQKAFAITIGFNQSSDKSIPLLQYADDDAIHNYELMLNLGAHAVLLTQIDPATKELYPNLNVAQPSLFNLEKAIDAINQKIDQAHLQNHQTIFYFFYTGHGSVDSGEGYVELADGGRLTRNQLRRLLARLHADVKHVIIDACKSYYLAFERGPGGKRWPTASSFLPSSPDIPKGVGFVLSTSSANDSHEWEAFQGGIFSHEVRSALRGGADLNNDGVVTYEEAGAFIYTANRAVPNEKYRPRFFLKPPSGQIAMKAVLADLRVAQGRWLTLDSPRQKHLYWETDDGIRLADSHLGKKSIKLVLPISGRIYVRTPQSAQEYVLEGEQFPRMSQLMPRPVSSRIRGAEHDAFRKLFSIPFDDESLRQYRLQPIPTIEEEIIKPHGVTNWLRPTIGIASLAIIGTGGLLSVLAVREKSRVNDATPNLERQGINETIHRYNIASVTCYGLGGLAAATYLIWQFWPRRHTHIVPGQISRQGNGLFLRILW